MIKNKEDKFSLIKELHKLQIPVGEQEKIFVTKTKNHKATFYRYRKKLDIRASSIPYKYYGANLGECYFCLKKAKHTHHINEDKKDNRKENLLPLCRGCHGKLHRIMVNFKNFLIMRK